MFTLAEVPCWYIAIAIIVSLYQACRGFAFQWFLSPFGNWKSPRKVWLLCLADMFTYFVCAVTGFIALFALWQLASQKSACACSTFGVFLALYGILGITAKLPDVLHKIQPPGIKSEPSPSVADSLGGGRSSV
jgi:hypothetical protein